uniref:B12D protein n=1 Tax=Oryza meridionalis TaxID=40149 RepID=A0A0E0EA34_9ORYZ
MHAVRSAPSVHTRRHAYDSATRLGPGPTRGTTTKREFDLPHPVGPHPRTAYISRQRAGQRVSPKIRKRQRSLLASPSCAARRRRKRGEEEKQQSKPAMAAAAASSAAWKRWIRPEVYPLFLATGVAVSICVGQLVRNITGNPEVRVLKEKRAAGVLENFDEGKRYSQHGFRKFIDGKRPEIMPGINSFFSDPPKY